MTTRTTTYAKAAAGQLEIIISGDYSASITGDVGFPAPSGADIVLECVVSDSGGQLAKTYIQRASPSAHLTLTYPGGSASWTVSVTDDYHGYGGGLGSISVTPQLTFILVKK
ncbi:MAG: hypothetical protein YHS30scaffold667_12 [Phage 65_10]|nr:MAG: hypothetical protein YHS30scaffold667_12 [Phage 65_10]